MVANFVVVFASVVVVESVVDVFAVGLVRLVVVVVVTITVAFALGSQL